MRQGTHAQAMQRVFRDGIAEGGHTAIHAPLRFGPFWRRCSACGAMSRMTPTASGPPQMPEAAPSQASTPSQSVAVAAKASVETTIAAVASASSVS